MLFQSSVVRHKFPLMAAYSRQVLSRAEAHAFMPLRVAGFPCLKVLRLIRHPIAAAFPVRVLRIRSCKKNLTRQYMGLPKFLCMPLRTCHSLCELRRSSTPSHSRVASALVRALITDASVLGSVRVKALPDRNGISELYQLSGTHGVPYGLHNSLCTLRNACSTHLS